LRFPLALITEIRFVASTTYRWECDFAGQVDLLLAGCVRGCETRFRWKECGARGVGWGWGARVDNFFVERREE